MSVPKYDPSDLLYGAPAIAVHVGMTVRQARHRIAQGLIPSFKMGQTVCALKSSIDAALAERAKGGAA